MTLLVIAAVVLGVLVGRLGIFAEFFALADQASSWLLCALLLVVGIGLGQNKEVWQKLFHMGWRVAMIPLAVALGSLAGAAVSGLFLDMPVHEAMTVGAGFGWYSLSGLMISQMGNVELGAVALLSNAFREIIAMLIIPLVAAKVGKIAAIAPGGATAMDTTMPLVSKACGHHVALLGFISGAILTALVPVIVPIIYQLG